MTRHAAAPGGRTSLRPLDRLRRRSEFQQVYDAENRCISALVLVHALSRRDGEPPRLGLTVSRRCGNACARNRIRRRLREIGRLARPRLSAGWDIVLTGRQGAAEASFSALRRQVLHGFERLGVLADHV